MIEAVILGAGVGLVSVLTGLGGGILMVPLLPLFLGFSQLDAIATSLFVVFLNSSQLVLISNKNKIFSSKKILFIFSFLYIFFQASFTSLIWQAQKGLARLMPLEIV